MRDETHQKRMSSLCNNLIFWPIGKAKIQILLSLAEITLQAEDLVFVRNF